MTQNEALDKFIVLLSQWNKKINLVQAGTMPDVLKRHIKDSLQVRDYLDKDNFVIDVGSGAGFPGIVLSIVGFSVVLCEKNFKKSVFLMDVKSRLNLDCDVFNGDVFDLKIPDEQRAKAVLISRAFGSLLKLLEVMEKLNVSRGIFHKGESFQLEINEAKQEFDFDYKVNQSITNKKSVILSISNVRRK